MDTNAKVQQFVSETGAPMKEARALLQDQNWNVEAAIRSYKFLQHAARPPAGPQKNKELSSNAHTPPTHPSKMNSVRASSPDTGGSGAGLGMAVTGGSQLVAQGVTGGTGQVTMPASPKVKSGLNGTSESSVGEKLTMNEAVLRTPASPGTLNRRLLRGLSKTSENLQLVSKARDIVLNDIVEDSFIQQDDEEDASQKPCHFVDTPEFTFILPDLTRHPADFRAFLHKDLIETSTLVSLEQAGRLNWWADIGACQRLLPLATTGDGNCLLHAASLGMWGFHDRPLTLRKALYARLSHAGKGGSLWRRWRWQQELINKQSGLIYDEREWATEWNSLLRLASSEPRTHPGGRASCCDSPATNGLMERKDEHACDHSSDEEVFYESLEELHVFVLAHVLRRPVIVVADTILKDSNGDALAPIPFGGIYLPLDCMPEKCHRSPLLLTYDAAHFSALVPMEGQDQDAEPRPAAAIPLVDPEFRLLPIHFLVDPGPSYNWSVAENKSDDLPMEDKLNLISQYLEVERVLLPSGSLSMGEGGEGSEARPRANSWSSSRPHLIRTLSIESDESNNSREGSNGKEGKEKTKMAKQMQSVAKSFGSIGKSMSKKLKKNFGGAGKGSKEEKREKKQAVGSVTQSTKTVGISVEMLKDKGHLLCAHLLHRRLHYQHRMMRNYLEEAHERFVQDRDLRRLQDEEIRSKIGHHEAGQSRQGSPKVQECINPDCNGRGTAATSYLCPHCYDEQKSEELHRSSRVPQHLPITVGQAQKMMPSRPQSDFQRQNTLVTSGKSKFYTLSNEEHVSPDDTSSHGSHSEPENSPQSPNNREFLNNYTTGCWPGNKNYSDSTKAVALRNSNAVMLARSSFYDEALSVTGAPDLVKPGTAVVVHNNLHSNQGGEGVLPKSRNDTKSMSHEHASLLRHPKLQHISDSQEPPLRPEFEKMCRNAQSAYINMDPSSKKDSNMIQYKHATVNGDGDFSSLEGKYITHVNVNMGQNSYKSDYKDPKSKCVSHGCEFFGTEIQDNLCSKCYKEKQRSLAYFAERQTTL